MGVGSHQNHFPVIYESKSGFFMILELKSTLGPFSKKCSIRKFFAAQKKNLPERTFFSLKSQYAGSMNCPDLNFYWNRSSLDYFPKRSTSITKFAK